MWQNSAFSYFVVPHIRSIYESIQQKTNSRALKLAKTFVSWSYSRIPEFFYDRVSQLSYLLERSPVQKGIFLNVNQGRELFVDFILYLGWYYGYQVIFVTAYDSYVLHQTSIWRKLFLGTGMKIISGAIVYPILTVRRVMFLSESISVVDAIKSIYKTSGCLGFYNGIHYVTFKTIYISVSWILFQFAVCLFKNDTQ
jgi:hypothetical protein